MRNELKMKKFFYHDSKTTMQPFVEPVNYQCKTNRHKMPTPKTCHIADNEKRTYEITLPFILLWIGIFIIQGVHFFDGCNQ